MADIVLPIKFKSGANAALPATATVGEPLWVTDTQELYVGTGAGRVKIGSAAIGAGSAFSAADKTKLDAIEASATADQTAAEVVSVASGNLAATDVQAALVELQTDIDGLTSIGASNYVAGTGAPAAGTGVDGNYYLDAASGNVYGPKAAGAWAGIIANVTDQLGLSAVAGAAPAAAGAVGTGTVAARSDHVHPFQSAADTASTAAGNLAATNVDAALAELQGDIDTLTTNTAGLSGATAAAVAANTAAAALNTAARHTHAVPAAVPGSLGTANQVWATNAGATAGEWQTPAAGVTAWTGLSDTPGAFTASNLVAANAGGTALEFVDGISGGTF